MEVSNERYSPQHLCIDNRKKFVGNANPVRAKAWGEIASPKHPASSSLIPSHNTHQNLTSAVVRPNHNLYGQRPPEARGARVKTAKVGSTNLQGMVLTKTELSNKLKLDINAPSDDKVDS